VQQRQQGVREIHVHELRGAVELVSVDVACIGRFWRFPVLDHQQPERRLASDRNGHAVDAGGIADAFDEERAIMPGAPIR